MDEPHEVVGLRRHDVAVDGVSVDRHSHLELRVLGLLLSHGHEHLDEDARVAGGSEASPVSPLLQHPPDGAVDEVRRPVR